MNASNNDQLVARDAKKDLLVIKQRFMVAYWIVICISIGLFVIALVLLAVPVLSFTGRLFTVSASQGLLLTVAGLCTLLILVWFRPDMKIHRLMGDLGKLTLVFDSYLTQVDFQLDQTRKGELGADEVCNKLMDITRNSMELVQAHYTEDGQKQNDLEELIKRI